jgi:hypothetical protein
MKALILHQPYATLVAIGVKQWETRNGPPNGSMRPAGVRGMPGLGIEPGERIAICAGKQRPTMTGVRGYGIYHQTDAVRMLSSADGSWTPLPLGRVVCTAVVAEAVRMESGSCCPDHPHIAVQAHLSLALARCDPDSTPVNISDQLPYGDWQPGRWAWRLTDVVQVDGPVEVVRGNRQGVFEAAVTWCFLCFMKTKAELERTKR